MNSAKKGSVKRKSHHGRSSVEKTSKGRVSMFIASRDEKECRICFSNEEDSQSNGKIIAPCRCSGSMKWVHQGCLSKWIKRSNKQFCPVCRFLYEKELRLKPSAQWPSSPTPLRHFKRSMLHWVVRSVPSSLRDEDGVHGDKGERDKGGKSG